MQNYLIKNVQVVNEGRIIVSDVLIKNGRIEKIGELITQVDSSVKDINGEGKYLLPGAIDDQVHFREPGLTHKATIYTEAKAAVAGGVTSFMEMPNTIPNALTQELLEEKYSIASKTSLANYSFFIFSKFSFMIRSSSQCVAISTSLSRNILSNVFGLSTSILPVDAPMKIFIPQTSFRLPFVFKTSSALLLLVPIKKE